MSSLLVICIISSIDKINTLTRLEIPTYKIIKNKFWYIFSHKTFIENIYSIGDINAELKSFAMSNNKTRKPHWYPLSIIKVMTLTNVAAA